MTTSHSADQSKRYMMVLSLAALGVVYGDIGTSPLYAIRECFHGLHPIDPTPDNILGVLSLIFWALLLVISIKYLIFILRADNHGEGGILALMALVTKIPGIQQSNSNERGRKWMLIMMGLFGAALLYGDGMITPAISVLSAVEGLNVATPVFEPYVIPITIVILVGLFLIQKRGTASVGSIFGPVTLLWFLVLSMLGIAQIVRTPEVLGAVNPVHAVTFFVENGWRGFLVLGTVFLVVTGGEALYADMGHFGRRPIRLTWFSVVLPSLLLNYFGQGALLIREPGMAENPFYRMAPHWALYPMVVLATAATVIASQALISGVFSLSRQAVQLGYSPRLKIEHTSSLEIGQIYIPSINWGLMLSCIGLVIGFGSSSNLAAAYGVSVTATMVITTILFYVIARHSWKWKAATALIVSGIFLIIDLSFFGANIIKVAHGGWFPLVVAAFIFTLMSTWKTGRRILAQRLRAGELPIEKFLDDISGRQLVRVPGMAVFMYGNVNGTPPALLHNIKHNKVLHDQVVILTVNTEAMPHVPKDRRVEVTELREGFWRVVAHYGFMEDPDIPQMLKSLKVPQLDFNPMHTTFFLGREALIVTKRPGMAVWREKIFAAMSRNARGATSFFGLPPNRVVEFGTQVEI